MKKLTSLLLIICLAAALTACGDNNESSETNVPGGGSGNASSDIQITVPEQTRTITIGIWWDEYYDSTHKDIYDNPRIADEIRAQEIFDNLKKVEERYNVRIEFKNLTWNGVVESINTSIMAGSPDCDIYYTDLQFGIPAVLNGYAQPIESFAPGSDVLTDQVIMKHLNILGDSNNYLFAQQARIAEGYPLGFNLTMIKENNLEDPRDLYDKGEWTWDVWRDYLQKLTKDIDGDGVTDIYGYGGYWTNMLEAMLLANNAHIAGGKTEGLSSPETREVLEFFKTIYVDDKTARPWILEDWESNLRPFTDGIMAFFITKDWIIQDMASSGNDLNYELGVVPWPYGPSGNKESSKKALTAGNWNFIPVGVKNPELVYAAYYDYTNWFENNTDKRDMGGTFDWQAEMYLNPRNFEMAIENGMSAGFDLWPNLNFGEDLSMVPIIMGESTPAQYAESQRQIIQDRLNAYFGD